MTIGFVKAGKWREKNRGVIRVVRGSAAVARADTQTLSTHTHTHGCSEERAEADYSCANDRNEEAGCTTVGATGINSRKEHTSEEERERRTDADDRTNNLHNILVEEFALKEHETKHSHEKNVKDTLQVEIAADACQRALCDDEADDCNSRANDRNKVRQTHWYVVQNTLSQDGVCQPSQK